MDILPLLLAADNAAPGAPRPPAGEFTDDTFDA